MTSEEDVRPAAAIGQRLKRYRLAMGIRTAKELAEHIGNPKLTVAVVQNIEAGRKVDVAVWQLLELAAGLRISPMLLLVDIDQGDRPIAIENTTRVPRDVDGFDEWWSMERPLLYETSAVEALDQGREVLQNDRDQLIIDRLRRRRQLVRAFHTWESFADDPVESRPSWLAAMSEEDMQKNRERIWQQLEELEDQLIRWGVKLDLPVTIG